MTNPQIMRLWSLAAVLLAVVSAQAAETTTPYPVDQCICDLKVAKAAEDALSPETRRRRQTRQDSVPLVLKRILFGFELNQAITEALKEKTLANIKDQVNNALLSPAQSSDLSDVYDTGKCEVGGMVNLNKVYIYINLKVEATEEIKGRVEEHLKGKIEKTDSSPPTWFGNPVKTNKEGEVISTFILAGPGTIISFATQLANKDIAGMNDADKGIATKALSDVVQSTFNGENQPFLRAPTARMTFGARNTVSIEIDFYEDVKSKFTEIQKILHDLVFPNEYTISPDYRRFIFPGPIDSFKSGRLVTLKMMVANAEQTTIDAAQAEVDTKMKEITEFKTCFGLSIQPEGEIPINLEFSAGGNFLDTVTTKMEELREGDKIQNFTKPIQGPDYMRNPATHITTIFTIDSKFTGDDAKKEEAANLILEEMKKSEIQGKIGSYVFSRHSIIEDNQVRIDTAFMPPIYLLEELDPIKEAIKELFTGFVAATFNENKISRGIDKIRRPENIISSQFTVADDETLDPFNKKEFLDKLTREIRSSDKIPEDFLWASSAKVEGQNINVHFRYETSDTDKKASLQAVLDELTADDVIADINLKADSEFTIPIPVTATTTPSKTEGTTGSTSAPKAEGTTGSTTTPDAEGTTGASTAAKTEGTTGASTAAKTGETTQEAGKTTTTGETSASEGSSNSGGTTPPGGSGASEGTNASGESTTSEGSSTSGETTTPAPELTPSTKYTGKKVKADDTTENCECNVECSVEMKFKATGFEYKDTYADTTSADFKNASKSLEKGITSLMKQNPDMGPYFIRSVVTQFKPVDSAVEIFTDVQLSEGYNCNDAIEVVKNVTEEEAKSGSFAGLTVDKDSFTYKEGTTESNKNTKQTNNRDQTSTTEAILTTKMIEYPDHNYFLTITIPVMVGVLLLIILIMCCMRKDSLCCKIFATDTGESAKLLA